MSLKQALLVAAIFLVSCGSEDNSNEQQDTNRQQVNETDVRNCCHCLATGIVETSGYYDYCFSGTEQQCVTALLKGASISSYSICFKQICVGDCWFLVND